MLLKGGLPERTPTRKIKIRLRKTKELYFVLFKCGDFEASQLTLEQESLAFHLGDQEQNAGSLVPLSGYETVYRRSSNDQNQHVSALCVSLCKKQESIVVFVFSVLYFTARIFPQATEIEELLFILNLQI